MTTSLATGVMMRRRGLLVSQSRMAVVVAVDGEGVVVVILIVVSLNPLQ